jgi:hypothetical protein
MTVEQVLFLITEKPEEDGIEYMMTGSFASNLHGFPRTTCDADIVISAEYQELEGFVEDIKSAFYVDLNMIRESLSQHRMFNVIHYV